MALYLDEQTRPYLERLIKHIKDTDFIGKRLQKMLEVDRERLSTIAHCTHTPGTYTGHKSCCTTCGSPYEPGMSESWTLDPSADHSQAEKPSPAGETETPE